MKKKWSLAEEIYWTFHRWPALAATVITGCLLGWLVSFLLPPHYRATSFVYVALNPYRTYSDTNFLALARPKYSNIDDYKDWQMSQLESVIYSDEFIEETLQRLLRQDPSWQAVTEDELRDMLEADWRSAGTWSLTANSPDANLAEQASSIWGDVAVERVKAAIEAARQTFQIDQEMEVISEKILDHKMRIDELEKAQIQLEDWIKETGQFYPDQPPQMYQRLQILGRITRLATYTPTWQQLLDNQPGESANISAYQRWIEQAEMIIDQETELLQGQILVLENSKTAHSKLYSEKANFSLGLSPNLDIRSIEKKGAERIRSTTAFIIMGGATAFLFWVLFQLVMITRKLVDE